MKKVSLLFFACLLGCTAYAQKQETSINWVHISSETGGIEAPNKGTEQTSAAIGDFDKDGINDFCITERTQSPSIVWYRRNDNGWDKHIVENEAMSLEAGTVACDVDGDGDLDIIAGGDGGKTKEVYWWENPYPDFRKNTPWKRHLIHKGGGKYHDKITGDFDGDGKTDLVFWSQNELALFFARIPENPKDPSAWECIPIYKYYNDGQMQQRGTYPNFKTTNEHEGLAIADIDGDGIPDIIGGGYWFNYLGNDKFAYNMVDASYTFSRCAAGQFIEGGRPEIVLVVGDGKGPLNLYEYKDKTWVPKTIIEEVSNGHTLSAVDFNGDGNLDIWIAEMTLDGNTNAENKILLGDGKGNFPEEVVISTGIDMHESKIADLDGDGDLDILGKPYNGNTPRLDIWLQNGTGKVISKHSRVSDGDWCEPVVPQGFGVNIHFTDARPGEMEMLAASGVKWIRMDFTWGATERERGKYDFSAYERLVNSMKKYGIRGLFILDYGNRLYDDGLAPHTDEGRAAFARWAVAAAKHFQGHDILWEMYNEPNIGFWKPKPNVEDYIKLAIEVGKAIREEAPGEKYIGPATSQIDMKFLEACFQGGLLEYWDAVSVHPYRQTPPETVLTEYEKLTELIAKYAPKGKQIPIVSGEWGYSAAWQNYDEIRQGKYLPRQWLTNIAADIPISIWYDWHDDGPDPKEPEHHFGMVAYPYHEGRNPVYDPKPAYVAAKTLCQTLQGYKFVKHIIPHAKNTENCFALHFEKNNKIAIAAWYAKDEETLEVKLPIPGGSYRIIDYLGSDLGSQRVSKDGLTLKLTDTPVYIIAQ